MTADNIQNMLTEAFATGIPSVIDVHDDEAGEWTRLTKDGVSRLIVDGDAAPNTL